jgi:hypothetical protein
MHASGCSNVPLLPRGSRAKLAQPAHLQATPPLLVYPQVQGIRQVRPDYYERIHEQLQCHIYTEISFISLH